MLTSKLSPVVIALTLVAGTVTTLVYAAEAPSQAEQKALENAQITLIDAIGRAEKQAGGKALEAMLENKDGTYVYEIHVVTDDGMSRLVIDPSSGEVLSSDQAGDQDDDFDGDEDGDDDNA
jgi:uncharacterized membrane protein YkoI